MRRRSSPAEAAARAAVLAIRPAAALVKHDPPGVRRSYRVQDGPEVIGEGRGPALAWRSAARHIGGENS